MCVRDCVCEIVCVLMDLHRNSKLTITIVQLEVFFVIAYL